MPDPSRALSGSETEREGDSLVYSPTSSRENRLSSAPTSPYRNRNQHASGSNYNTTSPARRKKRVSYNDDNNSASDDNHDEQRAPTVNLNSFKKTPLLGARRRSVLPHEFREGSIDEEVFVCLFIILTRLAKVATVHNKRRTTSDILQANH